MKASGEFYNRAPFCSFQAASLVAGGTSQPTQRQQNNVLRVLGRNVGWHGKLKEIKHFKSAR